MQLFHELKQKFPGVPDHAVSGAISACRHDRGACLLHLEGEARAALTHAYHASSSAAARGRRDRRVAAPTQCPNRPFPPCEEPQRAELSTTLGQEDNTGINEPIVENAEDTAPFNDKNQLQIFHPSLEENTTRSDSSPVTINIDSCIAKISETPSDVESDDTTRKDTPKTDSEIKANEERENTNYKILKSNKVRCNLNEKLEKVKEKPIIVKAISQDISPAVNEKPKRPCTLEFVKRQPELSDFKQQIPEPVPETCRIVSPVPGTNVKQEPTQAQQTFTEPKETTPGGSHVHWPEQGYPVNLSVNVNCHMDIPPNRSRTVYPNVWSEDYDSPRAFTSVNLTVCTPTSAMQSPLRETGGYPTSPEAGRGFEGHVTVTVSPSTARPPRRRAPPPPVAPGQPGHRYLPTPTLEQPPTATDALIARQRARKKLLDNELAQERTRLARLARETAVLTAPLPSLAEARRLRDYVEMLREECQRMTRKMDQQLPHGGERNHPEQENEEFYRNLYTGQRPPNAALPSRPAPPVPTQQQDEAPSWQCHVCTFRNHGLLNKCEECDMPRIVVGMPPQHLRTIDSGIASLTLTEARRLSTQIENNMLLSSGEAVERHANQACV